jgi:hypothetical protein
MYTEPAQTRFSWPRSPNGRASWIKRTQERRIVRQTSSRFEVLITVDQNLPFQQNITDNSIAIIILMGKSNRYYDLKMLAPKALHALRTIKAGDVVRIQRE